MAVVVRMVRVVRMLGVVREVRIVGVVKVVRVVTMVRVVRMVGAVRMVTLLAEHYFVRIRVGHWVGSGWFRCVMDFLSFMDLWSQQQQQLHESLANRLTYGSKPVKSMGNMKV